MRMQDDPGDRADRPTVPNQRPYGYGADANAGEREFGGPSTWPVGGGGSGADAHMRRSAGDLLPLALGASLGVNVALLLGLVGVLFLARAGAFSPSPSSAAQSTPPGSATSVALGTPTPTPTTPLSASGGWLRVAPSSVQVGCTGDQQTQYVVLMNSGPQDVQWQAVFVNPTDQAQAGVEVGPNQGTLHAGASVVLQIHTRNPSTTQQGVIRFEPDASAAGTPPSLTYTAASCG